MTRKLCDSCDRETQRSFALCFAACRVWTFRSAAFFRHLNKKRATYKSTDRRLPKVSRCLHIAYLSKLTLFSEICLKMTQNLRLDCEIFILNDN